MTSRAAECRRSGQKTEPKQALDSGRTFCKDGGNPHKTAPPSALTPSEAKELGDMTTALPRRTLEERLDPVKATGDFHSHAVTTLAEADQRFLDFLVDQAVKSCS